MSIVSIKKLKSIGIQNKRNGIKRKEYVVQLLNFSLSVFAKGSSRLR